MIWLRFTVGEGLPRSHPLQHPGQRLAWNQRGPTLNECVTERMTKKESVSGQMEQLM